MSRCRPSRLRPAGKGRALRALIGTACLGGSVWLGLTAPSHAVTSTTVNYSGTLIALPCTVEPGMENLYVDLGVTPTKSLYRFTRTAGKVFEFRLDDCDTSLGSTITGSFTAPLYNAAEGLLDFSPGSTAKGAGIGLETVSGTPITVNDGSVYKVPIQDGNMVIRGRAYVQGEQQALATKSLVPGDFYAVLTYQLSYE